jgi:putative tryptophan/tyrosine transport system substrate-binding protein
MNRAKVFEGALRSLGWRIGSNVQVDLRWAPGTTREAWEAVRELANVRPDVILAAGTPALQMILEANLAVPTVFVSVSDPVGEGFVSNLARPGGNITGFSQYEYTIGGKWLGLLKEMLPPITKVTIIMNAGNPASRNHLQTIESVAASFSVSAKHLAVEDEPDFDRAMRGVLDEPNHGLIFLPGITNVVSRARLIASANERHLPAIYPLRADAAAGG